MHALNCCAFFSVFFSLKMAKCRLLRWRFERGAVGGIEIGINTIFWLNPLENFVYYIQYSVLCLFTANIDSNSALSIVVYYEVSRKQFLVIASNVKAEASIQISLNKSLTAAGRMSQQEVSLNKLKSITRKVVASSHMNTATDNYNKTTPKSFFGDDGNDTKDNMRSIYIEGGGLNDSNGNQQQKKQKTDSNYDNSNEKKKEQSKKKPMVSPSSTSSPSSKSRETQSRIVEHYIKPNMTLEERVQARAEHSRRQQHRSQKCEIKNDVTNAETSVQATTCTLDVLLKNDRKRAHDQISSTTGQSYNNENQRHSKMSGWNLVRFADALRLYARHSISRSRTFGHLVGGRITFGNKVGGSVLDSSSSVAPSFITMALDDVRTHLKRVVTASKSLSPSPTTLSTGVGLSEKRFTSKEVTQVIKMLCNLVPEWISFSSVQGRKIRQGRNDAVNCVSGKKKSAHSIRLCESIPYQSIREKLGVSRRSFGQKGDGGDGNKIGDKSIVVYHKEFDSSSSTSSSSSSSSSTLHSTNSNNSTSELDNARKRSNKEILKGYDGVNQNSATNGSPAKKRKKNSKLSISARRYNLISDESDRNVDSHQDSKLTQFPLSSRNEDDGDEDPSVFVRKGCIEEKKMLRVNYYQHLADTDRDGGEVIDSSSTNPRGLKRMFSILNAGERI